MRFLMVSLLAALSLCAQSQLGSGAISGTVQDPTRQVIPDAKIVVVAQATGLTRETVSNSGGAFTVPVLPPGTYTVKVSKDGFATLEQENVVVVVGSSTTVLAQLKVGSVNESVTITENAVLIDTTKTSDVSQVGRQEIQDLPINGRRFDQFALLSPGVARDGRFGLLSYRGQSGVFNNFMVEGNDDNQAYFSEARGRTRIASNISANAIQEFQVGRGAFLAEFGRASGGTINAVVRSGTNDFHGDAFWYFRNKQLTARDPLATFRPDERRDQFGGSVSGAVIKDKLFYFLNYDQQLRDFPLITPDLSGVLTVGRPAATAPAADIAAFEAGVNFLRGRFPNGNPGDALPRSADQWLGLAKVDYNINQKHTLSVFYNHLHASGQNAIQTPLVLGNVGRNGSDDVRINSFNTRLTSVLKTTLINEFRFQWSRDHEFQFGNEAPPQVFVGGFSFGRATFLDRPALPDERRQQFVNNMSIFVGKHNIKFGGEFNRAYDIIDNPANFGASFSYANALFFGRDLLNPAGQAYTTFQQAFGLPGTNFATIDYAFFVQDQWRLSPRLTVNLGLRWDYQQLPDPTNPNPEVPETGNFNADRNNFGPRAGIAWDLAGDGKTVIRVGGGLYYARTPNGILNNALLQTGIRDPQRAQISITLRPGDPASPLYPNTLAAFPASASGAVSTTRLASDFERPRVFDISIGIDRQLFRNWTLSASYARTQGNTLPILFDTNLPSPSFERTFRLPDGQTFTVPYVAGLTRNTQGQSVSINASRPNPALGAVLTNRSIGESWYNALFVEIKKRYSSGFLLSTSYTFAKAENVVGTTNGGGFGGESPFNGGRLFNQFDLDANRQTAPTDQRHRLVNSFIWNLGENLQSGLARTLIRGFRLSGIYTFESGRPVTALVGLPNIPFTANGAQYNGFGGILGQGGPNPLPTEPFNSRYGEWNYRFDLRLARDFPIGERARIEFLAEGFNLWNTTNFNGFVNTIYNASSTTVTTPVTTPVQLNATNNFFVPNNNSSQPDGTNARRFQLAVRFRF
ncbi:MAG: carboxypeptidase regulatory-like domain-containing protein [Bryobacter sp.]|nr:carboxypeptidase regulatory-like domain-containing protein [Bryobacter sp.]